MSDQAYDVKLAGEGYMLARREQMGAGGRAWTVQPLASSRAIRTEVEGQYGNLAAQVEIPMVWMSGHLGYGDDLQLGPHRYHYAENIDARFPGQVINGPRLTVLTLEAAQAAWHVRRFVEFSGKFYFIAGRYVYEIVPDEFIPDVFVLTQRRDLGVDKAATDAIAFDGKLYVGLGDGDFMWVCSSTHTWSQSADVKRGYFTICRDRLYASDSTSSVRMVARGSDPAVAVNWSAVYNIGDSTSQITSLASLGDLVYVGKSDGVHILDASWISPMVTPELRPYAAAENCVNLTPWHATLWVPHLRGLLSYQDLGNQGFRVRSAGPGRGASHNNPIQGRATALAGDDEWLYLALYADPNTYVLAGREVRGQEASVGGVIWHPLATLSGGPSRAMCITEFFGRPMLWMGLGKNLAYMYLPRNSSNPLRDKQSTYAPTGTYYLPAHNWYSPSSLKVWKSVEIEAENLSFVNYIKVAYRIDDVNDTRPWIEHSDVVNRSPSHVLAFPKGGVSGYKIELRVQFVSGNSTEPILLRSVVLLGAERPSPMDRIVALIRCADNLPTRQGRPSYRTAAQIRQELRGLGSQGQAVELIDPAGTSRWVLVQPGIGEQEVEQEGSLARELLLQVELTAFESTSTQSVTGTFAVYGTTEYGDGDVYR